MIISQLSSQDIPCYDGWLYSKINGKCYKAIDNETSQSSASSTCSRSLSVSQIKPRLIRIKQSNDGPALADEMIRIGNNEPYWMDAQYDSKSNSWLWSDKSPVDMAVLKMSTPTNGIDNQCLKFRYYFKNINNKYEKQYEITSVSCSSNGYYVCEHESKPCDPVLLPRVPDTTQLVPKSYSVFNLVHVACLPGYFRPSELQGSLSVQGGIVADNYAYCTGSRSSTNDPDSYKSSWNVSKIETCQPVSCSAFTGTLNNVVDQVGQVDISRTYPFGYTYNVSCIRGYVSYSDNRLLNSSLTCQQSPTDKSVGIWIPQDYTPCVAIQCNITTLTAMTPINAALLSARNKVTQQHYDISLQRTFLTLFNNIITFQCNEGYFFPDRSWAKQVICDLVNDSMIEGDWQGYQGTSLPLYQSCQNATCKYESIIIDSEKNLKPYFMMMDSVGTYVNQTNPTGNPYPFQTRLLFYCKDGYNTGSGKVDQDLSCGPQGNWNPNLTPCILMVAPLNIGNAQHFVPAAVEAPSAQQIGCVAIVILVIFLSLIVILDMSTVARDMKLMKGNLQQLKRAMKKKT